jgi:ankyrin repeat protein
MSEKLQKIYRHNNVKEMAYQGNLNEIKDFLSNNKFEDNKELKNVIHIIFVEACRYEYLDIMAYILTDDKKGFIINNKQGEGFKVACACGRLDAVKYLLTNKSLHHNIDIQIDNNAGFRWACEYNQLEVIKYLLTSAELKVHANIHVNEDFGFTKASEQGYIEIVEYLLTNKELKSKANLNARDDYAFRFACKNEHKNMVKLLLSVAKESTQTIDIYAKNNQVIKDLIKENKYEMLNYLILELGLFEFKKVENIIKNKPEIVSFFEKRELNQSLNNNLKVNDTTSKVTKL